MKKILIVLFLIITVSYAKKDFYFGFIDSSGNQISEKTKQEIRDGFDILEGIKQLSKDGKIDEAYSQIKNFKEQNKIKVLTSDITILYSQLSLKKVSKRVLLDAAKELENAINSSLINEYDLAKAYSLLVELKLETNKIEDAKYFANIIIENFDDEITKTYGKISLAKVYKYQRDYLKATKVLYEILTITKEKMIATIVADELFDVYILDEKIDKAKELIGQVLKTNIEYYANDSYLATQKINKLIKVGMPEYAAEILKELLNKTTKEDAIEDFKFKLANTYMLMYDRTNFYLEKAKELYKDIINDYPNGVAFEKSKMYIDEILMRQGFIKPEVVAAKYLNSEEMEQKALLQELMNYKADKKFDMILKGAKIYKKISDSIAKRFGYESMNEIFDEVNIDLIKDYLAEGKCFELNKALKTSRSETLEKIIKDESIKYKFFECLIEVPYERIFLQLQNTFNTSRDANIYLYLERMAYSLNLLNEALNYSAKVEMVNDKDVLQKEFLHRYLILKTKADGVSLDKFFQYAQQNLNFIENNISNPIILDFFHDYYLYLLKTNEPDNANKILKRLYDTQKSFEIYVYSPFVESELAKLEKDMNNNQKSLDYLLEAVKNSRRIKADDEVKLYYEITKLYEILGNKDKKNEYLLKCKEVKNTNSENLYKKMCDEM